MKITPSQWAKIAEYLKKKLRDFNCPDSYIDPTAHMMANRIEEILEVNE